MQLWAEGKSVGNCNKKT